MEFEQVIFCKKLQVVSCFSVNEGMYVFHLIRAHPYLLQNLLLIKDSRYKLVKKVRDRYFRIWTLQARSIEYSL